MSLTVELGGGEAQQVFERIAQDLDVTLRDAVNFGALALTQNARVRYKEVLGPQQTLSGYWYTPKGTRVTGGRRLNPAYKEAHSEKNPVALVGVRGPAQLIEHPRKGGYVVKNRRARQNVSVAVHAARMAERQGLSHAEAVKAARRLGNPAIRTPDGPRASAKPGPIRSPRKPFIRMAEHAQQIVAEAVSDRVQADMEKSLRKADRGVTVARRVLRDAARLV